MNRHRPMTNAALERLSDTDLTLADLHLDIRGRKVIEQDGEEIGHVSDLFIDMDERKVRLLEVRGGGFLGLGDRHVVLPVDAITSITKDQVYVNETRERIARSPVYDPTLIVEPTREYWEPYYGYYGIVPYWNTGYVYPNLGLSPEQTEPISAH